MILNIEVLHAVLCDWLQHFLLDYLWCRFNNFLNVSERSCVLTLATSFVHFPFKGVQSTRINYLISGDVHRCVRFHIIVSFNFDRLPAKRPRPSKTQFAVWHTASYLLCAINRCACWPSCWNTFCCLPRRTRCLRQTMGACLHGRTAVNAPSSGNGPPVAPGPLLAGAHQFLLSLPRMGLSVRASIR